ncbi:MAG: hypothetical protein KDD48_00965 [Bdellovibrionales bacterium]|nr:hypothetical protein [Bdellovibrionales bacterium]
MEKRGFTIVKNILSIFFLGLIFACSTRIPPAVIEAYEACQYDKAAATLKKKADRQDKDTVLYQLALLSTSMRSADWNLMEKSFNAASQVMWSYAGKGKGTASLASSEAIKIFKGEPFEKAMASIYGGILYYNRGELDNARAAFAKSLLAMAQKKIENRQDFALGYFLQAKTFLRLGDVDNAKIALGKAEKVYPYGKSIFDLDRLKSSNVIFLVEVGQGPLKKRAGPGDSLVEWQRRSYPETSAVIFENQQPLLNPVEILDLTAQARSKGKTGKDTVQTVKGVTREAATATAIIAAGEAAKGNETAGWVALGAGLFAAANQSQADVRQWEFLPDKMLVSAKHLEPGQYQFRVRYVDHGQSDLTGMDQMWNYTVTNDSSTIFLVPRTRCKVNPWIGGRK